MTRPSPPPPPPERLDEIEKFARLQFAPADIGTILGEPDFVEKVLDDKTDEFARYHRGRLLAEAEVRTAILKQANNGSTPAQNTMLELMQANTRAIENEIRKKTRPRR